MSIILLGNQLTDVLNQVLAQIPKNLDTAEHDSVSPEAKATLKEANDFLRDWMDGIGGRFYLRKQNLHLKMGRYAPHGRYKPWDFRVIPQKQSKLDLEEELTCKPDLTFMGADGIRCIADTKYKDFSDLRFLNDDVYQMVTYLLQSRCKEGFLVYPVFQKDRVGKIKTIHIPHETGNFIIHALCISVESPEAVVAQIQKFIPASDKMLTPA